MAGGGYLLANIKCGIRKGVEINESARNEAKKNGFDAVETSHDIENEWADVIISNHALEHTFRPLDEIKLLRTKLRNGGKIIFLVPHEINAEYNKNNIDQHLYT